MTRKLAIAVALALAGIGVFAAISVGDEDSTRPAAFDRSFERVPAHATDAPRASASASVRATKKKGKGKPKVKYFETSPVLIGAAAGRADYATRCPGKQQKVLSGYYTTSVPSGVIVPDISAVSERSLREWTFGFVNATGVDGQAIIGVVCGKNL
jgi:hypothetical protein